MERLEHHFLLIALMNDKYLLHNINEKDIPYSILIKNISSHNINTDRNTVHL
jgi:hypothetical protein